MPSHHQFLAAACFLLLLPVSITPGAEDSHGRRTEAGHWLDPRVEVFESLVEGPFVRLEDGRVLAVVGNHASFSSDEGHSWTTGTLVADPERFSPRREMALLRTRAGTLILAFTNNRERHWTSPGPRVGEDEIDDVLPTYVTRSTDGGESWEEPQMLHRVWTGAVRDMVQTPEGRVLFTSMKLRGGPLRHTTLTYSTMDEGKTWTPSNEIDLGGAGNHDGATEAALQVLRDGRVLMLIRTTYGRFWEAISTDGRYWRELRPSPVRASSAPGMLTRLASGRLLLVWNPATLAGQDRVPSLMSETTTEGPYMTQRLELALAFSEDDGRTWSAPAVFARHAAADALEAGLDYQSDAFQKILRNRLAYPYVFEASPGEIWLTTMQGGLKVRFQESDFTDSAVWKY